MIVLSLDVKKDHFRPRDDKEEILCPKVLYLSVIGALMYLANCTRPDIALLMYLEDTALNQQKLEGNRTYILLSSMNH